MCRYKTGALARMAAELGVISAGGSESDAVEMGQACEEMGVGFQILDDVINLTTGNPGKKRGDDIVEGKKSLPVIIFNQDNGDTKALSSLFRSAASLGIDRGNDAVEEAIRLMEEKGSILKAKKIALGILEKSRKKIVEKYSRTEVSSELPADSCTEAFELINFMFDSFTDK
jgi:geranylgeranyl pyrophosphate synthase